MRIDRLAIAGLLVAGAVRADVYVSDSESTHMGGRALRRVDSRTNQVVESTNTDWFMPDGLVAEDGTFIVGASGDLVLSRAPFTTHVNVTFPPEFGGAHHSGWSPDGDVICQFGPGRGVPSQIVSVTLDGVFTHLDSPDADAGYYLHGMAVPTSGPFEGGAIGLAYRQSDETWTLYRYARQPDGTLIRTRRGPLTALLSRGCVIMGRGFEARQPVMSASGETILVPEGCSQSVKEFDLEGNFLGVFAAMPPLTGLGYPRDVNFPVDATVTEDGDVWVLTLGKLYRYAADGVLKAEVGHTFESAFGVFPAEYIPFASASTTCEAAGLGYWKRQCRSLVPAPSRSAWRSGRSGRSTPRLAPLHPSFASEVDLRAVISRADAALARHGVTTCAALWPEDPSDPRSKALMHLAAGRCNVASRKLSLRCEVMADGAPIKVSALLARIDALIDAADEDSCREAARLATSLHAGEDR